MLSRRGFLGGMLGALAAAAAGPVLAENPNSKYIKAIQLLDDAVLARSNVLECNLKFNRLLKHCRENFPTFDDYKTGVKHVRALLVDKIYSLEDIRGIPPKVADELYPVALARIALRYYNLPLNPSRIAEFDFFHETYGRLIVAATDTRQIG